MSRRLVEEIPKLCMGPMPVLPATCHLEEDTPKGACVVERMDLRSGTLVDRLIFDQDRLVQRKSVISDKEKLVASFQYDDEGRLAWRTSCQTFAAGEPEWSPSWRPPMVYHETATRVLKAEKITYGGSSLPPHLVEVLSVTETDEATVESGMKICYAYNESGFRRKRYQVYRQGNPGYGADTKTSTYSYDDGRLSSIKYQNVNLAKDGSIKFINDWGVEFTYNERGNLTDRVSAGSHTRLRYDANGRLSGSVGASFAWDYQGRLASMSRGTSTRNARYTYDTSGRIIAADYESDDGYRVNYSRHCPSELEHDILTPNVDAFLYYEGKDTY